MILPRLAILTILVTTVFAAEKYRRFHINQTISTRIVLRCPLAWSDDDSISFFILMEDGTTLGLPTLSESKDSFVVDVLPESRTGRYFCQVHHVKDNSTETVHYFIDRLGLYSDIQKLKYSLSKSNVKEANVGDTLSVKCPIISESSSYIWFGPDLLQLNNSKDTLEKDSLKNEDFGDYFCGIPEDIKDTVLSVGKIVIKLPSVIYEQKIKKDAKLISYPVFKLGKEIVYLPPSAYTLTRRLIWEYPPKTVLLNQGRQFNTETFTHDMAREEFYYRETDRVNPNYIAAKKVLFQSHKMGRQSFNVDINPSPASVIIGFPIDLFCNNSNDFKATWFYRNASNSKLQDLPEGVITKTDGLFTILKINYSEPFHSGIYVCDAKKGIAEVSLKVMPPPKLAVSPTEIVIRPGTSARFLCQLLEATGKIIWRRKDRKSFRMNVESRIGGDTQAILVIESVPKDLNGSVYECVHNELIVETLLMVKDLCPPSKRACSDGECIDESLFCNGVKDCSDVSDEDIKTCAQCEPNQRACLNVNDKKPFQKCVVRHWYCDGDNDCGNGYDELNCPKIDRDTCLSTHFACKDNQTLIPRSLWCDKESNCPNGEDEMNCRDPSIILPTKETTYVVHKNTSVSLICEVVSVPTSSINWRYNWGTLPQKMNFSISQTGSDCNRIKNTLTINNMHPDFAGVYTCEAVSAARAMGKDYTLFVTSETLCKRPYFNDGAWLKDLCLKCFCSNVTDDCTSATGYYQSPNLRVSEYYRGYLMNFMTKRIMETGNNKALFDAKSRIYRFDSEAYKSLVINPNMYLSSSFGLSGSWLESYSFFMVVRMKVTGQPTEDLPGPAVVIKGSNGKSLHWCRSDFSQVIYASETGHINSLKLSLWEKENWYNNIACSQSSTREDFLSVLSDVSHVLIRIKYYTGQTEFELHNITLEHAIAATKGESGVLVSKVEKCNCPFPYLGLSCEKCAEGYRKNSKGLCVKSCPINCEKCADSGDCEKCKGYRSGPQCMQCKSGFTRTVDKDMMENCVECPCGEQFNKTMIGNDCGRDLSSSGKIECKCSGREVNDPVCDICLRTPLLPEYEKKCVGKKASENMKCNSFGTEEIRDKKCICKKNYKGELCTECDTGHFAYKDKCLKCFCSNAAVSCTSSKNYKFIKLSLDSQEYRVNPKLTNRQLSGVYEIASNSNYFKVNKTSNKIVVKRNPNEKGLVYVTITIEDVANPDSINTYTMLYGGKIIFKFEYFSEKLKELRFNDVTPFLELESKKIGRLWIPFQFNEETKMMEAEFSEDAFPSWRMSNEERTLDRETFLRALMTAQHVSIGFPFDNENVKKVRISEFTVEHARKQAGEGMVAPVEECQCGANMAGFKCEACNKPGFKSVMTLSPDLPDFECGQCDSPSCKTCASGMYKYDFLTNTNFSSCQPGIEIKTKGRVIQVYKGESLSIPCSAKSYKGGVAVHTWTKRGSQEQLNTFRHLTDDKISNLIINFDSIKMSDSGIYICRAKNTIGDSSEEFSIVVIDKPARLKVDIFVETQSNKNIQYNVTVASPLSPTDYKIIWSVVKDGKPIPEQAFKVKVSSEKSVYKIDVEITANITGGVQIRGFVVGTRVTNPFQYEIRKDIKRNITINVEDMKISTDKNILNLKFLESGNIKVVTSPDVRTETFWYKVGENGKELPLPQGISRKGNDLTVWSASDQHTGLYVGYVINTDDGTKYGKVHTEIKVSPMIPNVGQEMFNITKTSNISIHLYVPLDTYCPNQSLELHNKKFGFVKDITKNVTRVSDKEVVVHHPLVLGDIVKFRCSVIPDANLTGEININLESKYPIIEIIPMFENSTFPVGLECLDKNGQYSSNITWYFNGKSIGNEGIINWKILGGFLPHIHEGTYTCFAYNSLNNITKSIHMPETRSGVAPGHIKIVSSTNEMSTENGTLKFYVSAGQKLEVGVILVGLPPVGTKIEWTINNKTILPTKNGKFFSNIDIPVVNTKDHYGTYRVQVLLPNGTMIDKSFEIVSQKALKYYVKIDGLNANGDVSILEGDNRIVGCKFIKRENEKDIEESNIKIDWKFVDSVGGSWTIKDILGMKENSELRLIEVAKAQKFLNQYRGQCIVNFNGETYLSEYFTFDVNQRNINHRVRLIGLEDDKYVVNEEDGTAIVTCQAYDEATKRVLPNAEYKWIMTFNTPTRKINWNKMNINNDKITFGGLIYHKLNTSAVGKCEVNYFGEKLLSNEFSFNIKRKELDVNLPKIKIEITYDSKMPPYPTSVTCKDSKMNSTANVTLVVSNPNFDRDIYTSRPGYLLINFTSNATAFNPYKDSGTYTFTVKNEYGLKKKEILLPQYKNPNNDYKANIMIYSTTGNIENRRIRVKANTKLKLLCVYYGHPYPISLAWTSKNIKNPYYDIKSLDYWTSINIMEFNVERDSGEYECRGKSHQGDLSEKVTVEGFAIGIKVDIFEGKGNKMAKEKTLEQGENFEITYRATDLFTNTEVKDLKGVWEYRFSNEDNFTVIDQLTFPKEILNFDGTKMKISEIARVGKMEIRCKFVDKTDVFVSDSVILKINENKELHPEPHFLIIHANESIYPTKLQCLDTSTVPTKLTLTKIKGFNNTEIKYVYKNKEILVEWKRKAFSPYYDLGTYQCTATGRYQNQTIYIDLPEENDRILNTYVKFESRINEIEFKKTNKSIDVAEGKRFMIICNYYGSRPPLTDVEIVLESKSGESQAPSNFATRSSSKAYYAEVYVDKFDATKHAGRYICRTRNRTHSFADSIDVKGVKPGLKVTVGGLDSENNLKLTLGSTKTLKCYAVDAISKNLIRVVKFDWNLETLKGEAFAVDDLSETVKRKDGSITFNIIKPNEGLRGRCEATSKAGTFYSDYFEISMIQDGTKKPVIEFVEVPGSDDRGFPLSLRCTDESSNSSQVKITRLSGEPPGVKTITTNNASEMIFPTEMSNPLLYVGSYRCDGVNKYGKDWKVIEVTYKRKIKPLVVAIQSKDVTIDSNMDKKTVDVPIGKKIELDCVYSGDNQPIVANWVLKQGSEEMKMTINKPYQGFIVYQKRSDCLSIEQVGFVNKINLSLSCIVKDTVSTTKTESININVIIIGTKVVVKGFDNGTETTVKQGSERVLSCSVVDLTTEKDISKNYTIVWTFTDEKSQKVELKDLASNVIEEDGNLKLNSLNNLNKTLFAHCFVNNGTHNISSPIFKYVVKQDEDKKPRLILSQTYGENKKFPTSLNCTNNNDGNSTMVVTRSDGKPIPKEWIQTFKEYTIINFPTSEVDLKANQGTYICKASNKYGSEETSVEILIQELLSVVINSTINKIELNKNGNLTTIVRKNRKLELNCYVTGKPTPKVEFSIITEGYRPDLPIPSRKSELVPGDVNSAYQVEVISDKHYRLSRQFYSQSPPSSFSCEATINNRTVSSEVKVEEVVDQFKVNIISYQQNQLNQIAFLEKPFKVGCEMRDNNNDVVKTQSIEWKFQNQSGSDIDLKMLAKEVVVKDNTLTLTNISLAYGNLIRGRCVAYFNSTYDTLSDEFNLNIKETPKITNIFVELNKKIKYEFPLNYTYDAKETTEFICKANSTNDIKPSISWVKCSDESCNSSKVSGQGSGLIFFMDSTKYIDSGEYRCIVKLELDNKVISEATGVIMIKRKAAPKQFQNQSFASKHSITLTCDNVNSSPEGNLTWSYIPVGKNEEEMLPTSANVKTENQISTLTINKPLKLEYSGTYLCKTVNEYGTGGRRFDVKVLSTSRRRMF